MNLEVLKKKVGTINIDGANLGVNDVNLIGMSEFAKDINGMSEEGINLILSLQNSYLNLLSKEYTVKPMEIDENGQVVVKEGMIFHRLTARTKKEMENYSYLGIVATEWFGKLESAREGCFCTFLNRVFTTGHRFASQANKRNREPNQYGQVVFYFDESHPIMQKLIALDYFEYEHLKKTNPELIKERYPQEYIDLIEKVISPLSPSGKNMRNDPTAESSQWIAVPGGIPPQLINGIAIHSSNKELMDHLDDINKMFPNATIFDENRKVLRKPLKEQENKKVRK